MRNDEANLILKVDCEGCEWEAIDFAARADPRLLSRFSLIILEVHVVESLLMRGEHGLALFSSFYDTLVDVHGFASTVSISFPITCRGVLLSRGVFVPCWRFMFGDGHRNSKW